MLSISPNIIPKQAMVFCQLSQQFSGECKYFWFVKPWQKSPEYLSVCVMMKPAFWREKLWGGGLNGAVKPSRSRYTCNYQSPPGRFQTQPCRRISTSPVQIYTEMSTELALEIHNIECLSLRKHYHTAMLDVIRGRLTVYLLFLQHFASNINKKCCVFVHIICDIWD